VLGVDPSAAMIDFACEHFVADHANLSLAVGNATGLAYRDAFDGRVFTARLPAPPRS